MSFNINPCKASLKKYGELDVNNINTSCFNTCAAFAGVNSLDNLDPGKCYSNCKKCVNDSVVALGKNPEEVRLNQAPIFEQELHLFPEILYKTLNPLKSLDMCIKNCSKSIYPNTCIENCKFDASSITSAENYKHIKNKYSLPMSKFSKSNLVVFYITFIIISLLLSYFLILFIKSLVGELKES
jgi:hypothetical protein